MLVWACLGWGVALGEQRLVIRIDVDGDGLLTAADDEAAPHGRFARVMANRDDDDADGLPDADDDRVNGPRDRADLVPIDIIPPATARVVRVTADERLRFFDRDGADARSVGTGRCDVACDGGPVRLWVESTAWAGGPARWDGSCDVAVEVSADDGTLLAQDHATLRVAPVLLRPSTAAAREVFIATGRYDNAAFVAALRQVLDPLGVPLTVYATDDWREMWMQDTMEIAAASVPGSSMRVVLAGLRHADRFPGRLLGPDSAVVEPAAARSLRGGDAWADWYGNLEVSPPTPTYPAGRILFGRNTTTATSFHPDVIAFLEDQASQAPVWIDTSWLLIKHVDEIIAFLPGDDGKGVMLMPDPLEGLRLADPPADAAVRSRRETVATRIAARLDAMLAGHGPSPRAGDDADREAASGLVGLLGIDPKRIVRLPVLFDAPASALHDHEAITDAEAVWSNPVNALFVNGTVICGTSAMPERVQRVCEERFREAGGTAVVFLDDSPYHRNHGNVHCATNASRSDETPQTPAGP